MDSKRTERWIGPTEQSSTKRDTYRLTESISTKLSACFRSFSRGCGSSAACPSRAWNRPLTPSVSFGHSLSPEDLSRQRLSVSLSGLSAILHKSELYCFCDSKWVESHRNSNEFLETNIVDRDLRDGRADRSVNRCSSSRSNQRRAAAGRRRRERVRLLSRIPPRDDAVSSV